jgi:phosphoserine phosphatase RsbU/P
MKLLTVDDDEDITAFFEATLGADGYDVWSAADGEEGWSLLEAGDFPIALLDWEMPGLSGVELCRRIRARTERNYTYVILVTARAGRADYLEAMAAGADDFVTKPVDVDLLRARLRVAQRVLALQHTLEGLGALITMCMFCQSVRDGEDGEWLRVDHYITQRTRTLISHGLCPPCYQEHRPG